MAKVPAAGKVKTRLQPALLPAQSAALAACFLQDAESKTKTVSARTIVAFFPPEAKSELEKILRHENTLVEQQGANLGDRMLHAFETAFAGGAQTVVMIGTDSPTVPADFIEQAFEFLETNSDVVLGKTEDGGFYLIGLRVLRRELFAAVEWSSSKTFDQVRRNVLNLELHLREVPAWYDVDEPADLMQLKQELATNENAVRRARQTYEWVRSNL